MLRSTLSAALLLSSGAIAQCTIGGPGALVPIPTDAWTAIQPIGFVFPFGGSTYTGFYITDHGMIALSNGGTPAAPPINNWVYEPMVSKLTAGYPLISPNWIDSWPTTNHVPTDATLRVDNTSGTHCTITFVDHDEYLVGNPATPLPGTTQVTLYPNGQIVMCIDNRVDNSGSIWASPEALRAILALTPGTGVLPAPTDISAGGVCLTDICFESWNTTAPNTPNPLYDVKNSTITFTPINPGWVVTFAPLACASNATYGAGCHSLGVSSNDPRIGTNWLITTTGISPFSPVAVTFFGLSRQVPAIPLLALGVNAPGCDVNIAGLLTDVSAVNVGGTSVLTIPIPNRATLKDASLTFQSGAFAPGANPENIAVSNGGEATVGW